MGMGNNILYYILLIFAGLFLGTFFYGGLWLTIQQGVRVKFSSLLFLVSMLLRTIIVVFGFYFLSSGNIYKLIFCFSGFFITRFLFRIFIPVTGKPLKSGAQ
jgi:F1F0 ATPase subunit 2